MLLTHWLPFLMFPNVCLIGFKRKKSVERFQTNHFYQIETNTTPRKVEFPTDMFKNHESKYGTNKSSQ